MQNDTTISEIAKALGRRGGQKTFEKYGLDHYKKISNKAVKAKKAKRIERLKNQPHVDNFIFDK